MCIVLCIVEFVFVYSFVDVYVESRSVEYGFGSIEFGFDVEVVGSGLLGGVERYCDG